MTSRYLGSTVFSLEENFVWGVVTLLNWQHKVAQMFVGYKHNYRCFEWANHLNNLNRHLNSSFKKTNILFNSMLLPRLYILSPS